MKKALLAAALLLALPVAAQVDDYRDIKYPEFPKRELPRPERYTLPNGETTGFDVAQAYEKIKHERPGGAQ